MSQGLAEAAKLVKDNELTAITLHSDGYANDPSATNEAKAVEKLIEAWHDRPIFVNPIAYSDSADFRFLSRIANGLSGTCVKAGSIKDIYDALHAGERAITSFNRNWQNRMGLGGEGYLASPAVVAASALVGYMAPPSELGLDWNPEVFGI